MLWDHSILERSGTKRDFTWSNFRTRRVVCDVVCDLAGRDVLGAPRTEGRSIVAGRRGRRPLPAFRSTASFESCGPFGSGMPREEEISRGATSVPGGSVAMSSVLWWARRPLRAAHRRTFHCRGPPRTSAPTSVQVYGAIRELLAVRFGDAQGGRDFTRNNFRTRVVCDVVCDLVGRDVLGAPRAWGRSVVAGRRGRRPLPAFRSTVPFESCGPRRPRRAARRRKMI